ncbi:MAG: ATP-dependent endonuclease, partial [Bacteroidales bacterium]|nr:ATP-dependent endonuclease [Bacteroidales bacterium]
MNFEQIKAQVLQFFGFEPTSDQNRAIDEILQFLLSREDDEVFVLKGYAGTGKTTLVSALIKLFDKM